MRAPALVGPTTQTGKGKRGPALRSGDAGGQGRAERGWPGVVARGPSFAKRA